jgi:hypothetical protein
MAAPGPPAPPMPPPMPMFMRNKARNYDCYRKQNGDGSVTYGFLIRRYQSHEGEKAIFVNHRDGENKLEHVSTAKLELVDREQCAHIPNQDKLMMYEGGKRKLRKTAGAAKTAKAETGTRRNLRKHSKYSRSSRRHQH